MTKNLFIHVNHPWWLQSRKVSLSNFSDSSAVDVRLPDGEPAPERLERVKAVLEFFPRSRAKNPTRDEGGYKTLTDLIPKEIEA